MDACRRRKLLVVAPLVVMALAALAFESFRAARQPPGTAGALRDEVEVEVEGEGEGEGKGGEARVAGPRGATPDGPLAAPPPRAPGPAAPPSYDAPRATGTLGDRALREVSGLAASRRNPGLFWAHNDSGDGARIFAIDRSGALAAEIAIPSARNQDWEDIAVGPGPAAGSGAPAPAIYIADVGDNSRARADLVIWRLPEPALEGKPRGRQWAATDAAAIRFRYADGRADCEALAVHPETGDLYLVTKTLLQAGVYKLAAPHDVDGIAVAERIATLRVSDAVTAADIAPDGRRCLVRTYLSLVELRLDDGAAFDAIFSSPRSMLPVPADRQGEAACYTLEGGILTTSEGVGAAIHELASRVPRE